MKRNVTIKNYLLLFTLSLSFFGCESNSIETVENIHLQTSNSINKNAMVKFASINELIDAMEEISDTESRRFSKEIADEVSLKHGINSLYNLYDKKLNQLWSAKNISELNEIKTSLIKSDHFYFDDIGRLLLKIENPLLSVFLNESSSIRIGNSIHIFQGMKQIMILDGNEDLIPLAKDLTESSADKNILVFDQSKLVFNKSQQRSVSCNIKRDEFDDRDCSNNCNRQDDLSIRGNFRLQPFFRTPANATDIDDRNLVVIYICQMYSDRLNIFRSPRPNLEDNMTWNTGYGVFSTNLDLEDRHGTGWSDWTARVYYTRRVFDSNVTSSSRVLGDVFFTYNSRLLEFMGETNTRPRVNDYFSCN